MYNIIFIEGFLCSINPFICRVESGIEFYIRSKELGNFLSLKFKFDKNIIENHIEKILSIIDNDKKLVIISTDIGCCHRKIIEKELKNKNIKIDMIIDIHPINNGSYLYRKFWKYNYDNKILFPSLGMIFNNFITLTNIDYYLKYNPPNIKDFFIFNKYNKLLYENNFLDLMSYEFWQENNYDYDINNTKYVNMICLDSVIKFSLDSLEPTDINHIKRKYHFKDYGVLSLFDQYPIKTLENSENIQHFVNNEKVSKELVEFLQFNNITVKKLQNLEKLENNKITNIIFEVDIVSLLSLQNKITETIIKLL